MGFNTKEKTDKFNKLFNSTLNGAIDLAEMVEDYKSEYLDEKGRAELELLMKDNEVIKKAREMVKNYGLDIKL